jgi:hypothetical protein
VPGGLHTPGDARTICDRVGTLFEIQGARVTTIDTPGRVEDPLDAMDAAPPPADGKRPLELTLEVRGRQIHQAFYPLSWALCYVTFTMLPAVSEGTFAQDIVVRDGSGFLLASESIQGRHVHRFGAGTWVGNTLLDLARKKEDRVMGKAFERDLSNHVYGQMSQILFNARIQAEVLRDAPKAP